MDKMAPAVTELAEKILRFKGDGDYEGAKAFIDHYGQQDDDLKKDIDRIAAANLCYGLAIEDD